jgi:beta-glucosidase/6-phospho-beta-glucosidase/beta-galactosidase
MLQPTLFRSFFLGGFECSTHRRSDGRRLDLLAATGHDQHAESDYRLLARHGIRAARDGLRWHLIEPIPGRYDWSSFLPMLWAARAAGTQVIWDLCHYGWPDDLDVWQPAFVDRFARFAGEAARLVRNETDAIPFWCPINEISYWAWAGGEIARMNPGTMGRGAELKRQLVRAVIGAIEAVREVDHRARIVHAEPLIHVVASAPEDELAARSYSDAQYEACDMLSGRFAPELGGNSRYLDVVGVNFYWDNQWTLAGPAIGFGHPFYQPLSRLLHDVHQRYGRPMLITETGAEGECRQAWLHHVAAEAAAALALGVPLEGVCFYPILDYPGWEDQRACACGLFGPVDANGGRRVHEALAAEFCRQGPVFAAASGHRTLALAAGDR